jgi:glucose/arabinose dehydrogenase
MFTEQRVLFLVLMVYLSVFAASGQAQPDVIGLRPVLSHLDSPVYLTNAGDGSDRLFIVEQRGLIKVLQPGATTPTVFLDVSSIVSSAGGERGLWGLAFHPQYSTNRRFFIYYSRESDGAAEIAEYETSTEDQNRANPSPVRVIITIEHPAVNHYGGTILFGPDGYLYGAIGDGTGGNDTDNNAQNINVLLGKFIRIDVNTPVGQIPPYNIPPTNPYAGKTRGMDEIYAIGFRNPYRFSFDRGGTHQLWAGDVGQEAREEIDTVTRGGNYGWRVYEGNECSELDPDLCTPANYLPPVLDYSHGGDTGRCSVIGGQVYRGTLGTFASGTYVYADLCSGEVFNWSNGAQSVRLANGYLPTAIGEDESGELYLVSLGGTVHKLVRRHARADFDGDLRTDVSVFRPSDGTWNVLNSSDQSIRSVGLGQQGDIPVAQDFDGDLISDVGVFRSATGEWFYCRSSDGTVGVSNFGNDGDIPAAADYDGDQKADLAVFRPSTGEWYIFSSITNMPFERSFGVAGDIPAVGDYDGDGRDDIAVWRPSNGTWYWANGFNDSFFQMQFGLNGDIPTLGDFDGDGRADIAVYRPSEGGWYTTHSQDGSIYFTQLGSRGDVPAVGDYDGDGLDDIAVFRPSKGTWSQIRNSDQTIINTRFGLKGDLAGPKYAVR